VSSDAKPKIDPVRWQPPSSRQLPAADLHPDPHTVAMPGPAPEDVVVDGGGAVWTGLADGTIVRIDPTTLLPTVVTNTGGRPLGLAIARDGSLLVCDSHRGLLRMDTATGEIETLVSDVATDDRNSTSSAQQRRALTFCSNVVESSNGTIYFTESTSRFHYENYKGAIIEARGTGALHRRATDGTVTTLVSGLYFANGVTLTTDESAIVFAETQGARVSKYWLSGPAAGTVTPLATELPGYPDNISTGADGRIWVAMVSDRNAFSEWLAPKPTFLRKLLWLLPYRLLPDVEPLVWVVALDPDDGHVVNQVRTVLPAFGSTTGVVQDGDRIWLAGIGGSAVAWFDL
jgi:sugar lactone lactonase YvrE